MAWTDSISPAFKNHKKIIDEEHKSIKEGLWLDYSHSSQKKTGITDKELMGNNTRLLLEDLSSQPFMEWLEELTQIKNLIPDPDLGTSERMKTSVKFS